MTEKLSAAEVLADLEAIVQEYGADHTETCMYSEYVLDPSNPDRGVTIPRCIAGMWVNKRAPKELVIIAGSWDEVTGLDYEGYFVNREVAALAEEDAHRVLYAAQLVQDGEGDNTWGAALKAARETFNSLKGQTDE